jgi:hypothetical protein
MSKLVLAGVLALAATSVSIPVSWAQDFNPGTVVGNVYQDPASGCGCGYGHGCCPPQSYASGPYWRAYPYDRHKKVARHSAAAKATAAH